MSIFKQSLKILAVITCLFTLPATASAEDDQIMCTMDAKQCPDGSYVSRTGPKCEFAPCPGEDGSQTMPPVENPPIDTGEGAGTPGYPGSSPMPPVSE